VLSDVSFEWLMDVDSIPPLYLLHRGSVCGLSFR
jgi:hypothetical protein